MSAPDLARAKAPEAFRTISEVAGDLDVPQHVLRFWETRFSQIRPMKRAGGRRFYRPADIDLLKGIRHLLYGGGYTIRGVQRILKEEGVAHLVAVGRGEVQAARPAMAEPDEPITVAVAPRIGKGGQTEMQLEPRLETRIEARAAAARAAVKPGLTADQQKLLREAMAELAAAKAAIKG